MDVDRIFGIGWLDDYAFFLDPDRRRPHSTFTSYEHLMDAWDVLHYRTEPDYGNISFGFNDEDMDIEEGENVSMLKLDYSFYIKPEFKYDEEEKVYYRYQFDKEHIDAANGEQLKFKNIIVQNVKMWRIENDPNKCMDGSFVSSGSGIYLTNGKMIQISWEKSSHNSATRYYTEEGEPLLLNPGKTIVNMHPSYRKNKIIME